MLKNICILSLLLFLYSCNKEDCTEDSIDVFGLEICEHSVLDSFKEELDNTYYYVSSKEQFLSLFNDDCAEDIDFEKYDLIIGMQGLSRGLQSIDYEYVKLCNNDSYDYTLHIVFRLNETTIAPKAIYHSLIPKLNDGERLKVSISII